MRWAKKNSLRCSHECSLEKQLKTWSHEESLQIESGLNHSSMMTWQSETCGELQENDQESRSSRMLNGQWIFSKKNEWTSLSWIQKTGTWESETSTFIRQHDSSSTCEQRRSEDESKTCSTLFQNNFSNMVSKALFSSNTDEWYTPHDFFQRCSDEVWWFDLDPCASHENKKAEKYFTVEDDWLNQEWFWKVFVNPPYSDISKWVEKCSRERERVSIIYLLIPARTDTRYFHDFLYKKEWVELHFIKWRLKFWWAKNSAPFPSLLAVFSK